MGNNETNEEFAVENYIEIEIGNRTTRMVFLKCNGHVNIYICNTVVWWKCSECIRFELILEFFNQILNFFPEMRMLSLF